MSIMLIKAVSLLVPAFLLLWYFLVLFKRGLPWSALQLVGAAALMSTVLTHVREAPALFPWMGWEAESSPWSLSGFVRRCSRAYTVSDRIVNPLREPPRVKSSRG